MIQSEASPAPLVTVTLISAVQSPPSSVRAVTFPVMVLVGSAALKASSEVVPGMTGIQSSSGNDFVPVPTV